MPMKEFSYWEKKRIRQALVLAIDHQWSLLDVHRTVFTRNGYKRTFPHDPETQAFVKRWLRDIKAFEKLLSKLKRERGG